MDPEQLKRDKEKEREKIRQEVLAELQEKYYFKPKAEKLEVNDILTKYRTQLLSKSKVTFAHNGYSQFESICQALRKVVCLHFNVYAMKEITPDKYKDFRKELERVIVEYCNCERS